MSFRYRTGIRRCGVVRGWSCAGSGTGEPARSPVACVERIDAAPLDVIRLVIPNCWKREILDAVDLDPASHAERAINREEFSRRPRNDLGLKPAVLWTLTGVELPNEISGDSSKVANQDLLELVIADWTSHRSSRPNLIPRHERFRLHSRSQHSNPDT
jgi:hypothetical protein